MADGLSGVAALQLFRVAHGVGPEAIGGHSPLNIPGMTSILLLVSKKQLAARCKPVRKIASDLRTRTEQDQIKALVRTVAERNGITPRRAPCRRRSDTSNRGSIGTMESDQTAKTSQAQPGRRRKRGRSLSPEVAEMHRELAKLQQQSYGRYKNDETIEENILRLNPGLTPEKLELLPKGA